MCHIDSSLHNLTMSKTEGIYSKPHTAEGNTPFPLIRQLCLIFCGLPKKCCRFFCLFYWPVGCLLIIFMHFSNVYLGDMYGFNYFCICHMKWIFRKINAESSSCVSVEYLGLCPRWGRTLRVQNIGLKLCCMGHQMCNCLYGSPRSEAMFTWSTEGGSCAACFCWCGAGGGR